MSGGFVSLGLAVGFDVDHSVDWCGEVVVEGVFDFVGYVVTVRNRDQWVDCDGRSNPELVAVPSGSEFG